MSQLKDASLNPVARALLHTDVGGVPTPVSNTNPLPSTVTGGLTDAQLRATAVPVDTEMPTAAALADGAANPTAPLNGAANQVYNGTTWDRLRTAVSDALASTGLLAVGNMLWNGTTWDRARSKGTGWQGVALVRSSDGTEVTSGPATDGDSGAGSKLYAHAHNDLFNGATWDRQRGNAESTVLASAARTALTNSPDQVNYNGRAIQVFVNVTAYTAGGLTPKIQFKDALSGNYLDVLTGAKLVATGLVMLTVSPHLPAVANLVAQAQVPRTWRVVLTPDDATSITYSVAADTLV